MKHDTNKKEEILQAKQLFFHEQREDNSAVRPEVFASWKRCLKAGISPSDHIKTLQPPQSIAPTTPEIKKFYQTTSVNKVFQDILAESDAALFWADIKTKQVFTVYGASQTIEALNTLGLGIGSYLTEETLGTCACCFGDDFGTVYYSRGEEHYLDELTKYNCIYFSAGAGSDDFSASCGLLLFPKTILLKHLIRPVKLYAQTHYELREHYSTKMRMEYFKALYENSSHTMLGNTILCDHFGTIVDVNHRLTELLKLDSKDLIHKNLYEFSPEFLPVKKCVDFGKKIQLKDITLTNKDGHPIPMKMNASSLLTESQKKIIYIQLFNQDDLNSLSIALNSKSAHYTFDSILGESESLQNALQLAKSASHTHSSVLITGESGTGKELFAQAIHQASSRSHKPFVAINCAAFTPELITSELFGYVEGAFTGAKKGGGIGKFEFANHGTLFLDEIGDMPLSAQALLLRAIEQHEIVRIGSNTPIPVDVRIICATNKDLESLARKKLFREDLLYRINVIRIRIPALRERISDIPILTKAFLMQFNNLAQKNIDSISPAALELLQNHSWPGNIRELRNAVEFAVNNSNGKNLNVSHFKPILQDRKTAIPESKMSLFSQKESEHILNLMVKYAGNKKKVAQELGICTNTLRKRLMEYHID